MRALRISSDSGNSLNGGYTDVVRRQTQACGLFLGLDRICGGHQYILTATAPSNLNTTGIEWGYTRAMLGSGYTSYPGLHAILPLAAQTGISYMGLWFGSALHAWSGQTGSPAQDRKSVV